MFSNLNQNPHTNLNKCKHLVRSLAAGTESFGKQTITKQEMEIAKEKLICEPVP